MAEAAATLRSDEKDLATAFLAARGRRAEQALHDMMDLYAPHELGAFLRRLAVSDHPDRERILSRDILRDFAPGKPEQGFRRRSVCAEVSFYSDGGDPRQKALLLCFGGLGGRLGLPISVLLQWIDARRFDVVTLHDPRQSRFRQGAGRFAANFVAMVGAIDTTFSPSRYARVIAFGNSMGGNPAVHYALLAGAERAIAIGARPPSDPLRLILRLPVPTAFDPSCDCLRHRPLRGLWLYGSHASLDVEGGETLFRLVGGQRLAIAGFSGHNVVGLFWERGEMKRLLTLLFDSALPQTRDSAAPEIRLRARPLTWVRLRLRPAWLGLRYVVARGRRAPAKLWRIATDRTRRDGP